MTESCEVYTIISVCRISVALGAFGLNAPQVYVKQLFPPVLDYFMFCLIIH